MKYTTTGDGNFTHAADLGGVASGIFFQDATEVVTFRAYYPHSGDEGTEPGQIAVDTKNQTADGTVHFRLPLCHGSHGKQAVSNRQFQQRHIGRHQLHALHDPLDSEHHYQCRIGLQR